MTGSDVSADALRALVREALLDVLPEVLAASGATAHGAAGPRVEHVRVADDADLAAFAARVLAAADDVRAGRLVFRLLGDAGRAAPGAPSAPAGPAAAPTGVPTGAAASPSGHHVAKGAVTERHVRAAERAGGRLVLGPRAVLTPLARDRARSAGVEIVRTTATSTDTGRH